MTAETLILKEINIFPELFLGIAIIYLVLHGTFVSMKTSYPLVQNSMLYLGSLILILCFILLINEKLYVLNSISLNNSICNDYSSFITKSLITLLSLFCLLTIQPYLNSKKLNQFEYVLLLLFSILGLFILCGANDLITAYLAIELQTLSFYVLAAFNRNSTFSIDAGIKYFILGSFSSALFLFGSSLIYGFAGTINFSELKDLFLNVNVMPEKKIYDSDSIDFFSELYYHSLLLSKFEYDLSIYLVLDPEILNNFYFIKDDLVNFNLNFLIDQLSVYNYVIEKYGLFLLSVLIQFKGYELGFLFNDFYDLKDMSEGSGFLVFLSLCEIMSSYLVNPFLSTGWFKSDLISFSLLFLLISLFFKLALVPFHSWAPDVYENSPSSSTFFFSVVPKIAIFILSLRLFYSTFYGFFDTWIYIVSYIIVLSVLVGSFGGLEQRKLKSLLVYSSISHMGYSLIVFNSGIVNNLQILLCYLIIYSFSSLCIWSIFIYTRVKNNRLKKQNKDLTDLVALYKSNYTLAAFFSVILFSIAGFPPMIGFLVKINVFSTALESSMYFVALISILCSVIATFFYIRIVKIIYFEKIEVGKLYYPVTTEKVFILAGLLWCSILLFINPTLLFLVSQKFNLLFI